ncbi:MAG: alkaline phosphatase family protein, partial [Chitinophagaceae bacterium]
MFRLMTLISSFLLLSNNLLFSQTIQRPKLVVGIVVDQMRWDYLYRYYDRYSAGGFKRMLTQGFSCENAFIPYTPTYTAAGHTCVYTGSIPAINGIIGNSWYRRDLKRAWYCAEDSTVISVGSTSSAGKMSPRNMWTTTITDELRLATNFNSKSIGIALKDRGAILPAGHSANAAYWFDNSSGGWITSTYYMNELPDWVKKINDKKLPDQYLQKNWNTIYPINTYKQSTEDNKSYEAILPGEDNTFPHETASITTNKYETFRNTPYGNTFTFDLAKAAIDGEQLGQRGATDFLALSFSSTDYVGHAFGPNSIEVEDTYLRLDQELAAFYALLDAKLGKGQYLVFLTAD